MKRILRIGMDVHSTNYTLCAIEPRLLLFTEWGKVTAILAAVN